MIVVWLCCLLGSCVACLSPCLVVDVGFSLLVACRLLVPAFACLSLAGAGFRLLVACRLLVPAFACLSLAGACFCLLVACRLLVPAFACLTHLVVACSLWWLVVVVMVGVVMLVACLLVAYLCVFSHRFSLCGPNQGNRLQPIWPRRAEGAGSRETPPNGLIAAGAQPLHAQKPARRRTQCYSRFSIY